MKKVKQGTFYGFIGLAGVGKTEMAMRLYDYLKSQRNDVVFFDGDILRDVEYTVCGYTRQERVEDSFHFNKMIKLLLDQGINIVYSTIGLFDEVMEWQYQNYENYVEIYITTPMEILKKNNKKNLYSGEIKDVIGMDIPFDEPKHTTCHVYNDFTKDPQQIVEDIIKELREKGKLIV